MRNCNSLLIFLILLILSCNTDDRTAEPANAQVNLIGRWKLDHYEVKGKIYKISECDANDKININTDKTGSYIDSENNTSVNGCKTVFNLAGKWRYESENNVLKLDYTENDSQKIKIFEIDAISTTELRIFNSIKVLDNVPNSNQVLEVWTKI